ncbi:MAG TPA: hypothetical protein VJ978_11285, partial [Nitriliruptoraceae bacterium]|nr:hypothetical protein [Nitriliruptoraceae bacterium]
MSDRRQRARVATFAAGAMLSSLLVAAPALAQQPSVPASSAEIDRLELELEDAESQLAAIAAREDDLEVEAVEARSRLEDADRAVAAAVATQAQADAEQDVADEAAARAAVRLREASDALVDAEDDLAATRSRLAELRDQLRDRARAAYMQGSGFGIVELLLNIQDYDDISRVQLLVAEVIEHDDELVDEWVELQILSEEQVEEAA